MPRSENEKADTLAKLAASLTLLDERKTQITIGGTSFVGLSLGSF